MKLYKLILKWQLLVISNVYSDSFLTKFHQNEYKVKDTRVEVASYNKEYMNFVHAKSFKYNRSVTAHNVSLSFKIDVKNEMQVTVQGYKFLSNEYRVFPIRFLINACDSINVDIAGLGAACWRCGNFCPCYHLKNITYGICNLIVDETLLPPLIPSGRFMAEGKAMYKDRKLFALRAYAEIFRPIKYN